MNSRLLLILLFLLASRWLPAQKKDFPLSECAKVYYRGSNTLDSARLKLEALRGCMIGKRFPSFMSTTLSGKEYSTAALLGKVVFITSWFSSCGPCLAEMPMLNELNLKFGDKEFILLSFSPENPDQIKKFLATHPLTYDVFPDAEDLIMYRMQTNYGYPTNIILNKKGEIIEFKTGTATDEKGLAKAKAEFIDIIEGELSR